MSNRAKAITYCEHKIMEHQRALETIKHIPTDKVLHVIRKIYCQTGSRTHRFEDCGTILIARSWNIDSLRCHILAVEKPSHAASRLIAVDQVNQSIISSVRFLDFKTWKMFDKEDAGLYVNWAALSKDFKQLAYDA